VVRSAADQTTVRSGRTSRLLWKVSRSSARPDERVPVAPDGAAESDVDAAGERPQRELRTRPLTDVLETTVKWTPVAVVRERVDEPEAAEQPGVSGALHRQSRAALDGQHHRIVAHGQRDIDEMTDAGRVDSARRRVDDRSPVRYPEVGQRDTGVRMSGDSLRRDESARAERRPSATESRTPSASW
jgi:hypothetical protein